MLPARSIRRSKPLTASTKAGDTFCVKLYFLASSTRLIFSLPAPCNASCSTVTVLTPCSSTLKLSPFTYISLAPARIVYIPRASLKTLPASFNSFLSLVSTTLNDTSLIEPMFFGLSKYSANKRSKSVLFFLSLTIISNALVADLALLNAGLG